MEKVKSSRYEFVELVDLFAGAAALIVIHWVRVEGKSFFNPVGCRHVGLVLMMFEWVRVSHEQHKHKQVTGLQPVSFLSTRRDVMELTENEERRHH